MWSSSVSPSLLVQQPRLQKKLQQEHRLWLSIICAQSASSFFFATADAGLLELLSTASSSWLLRRKLRHAQKRQTDAVVARHVQVKVAVVVLALDEKVR
jgi:rhamnogalacturonyl hydrolase YesR